MSLGNVCNNVWWAHRNTILIVAFLSIPKSKVLSIFHVLEITDLCGSWEALCKKHLVLTLLAQTIPCQSFNHSQSASSTYAQAWNNALSWQTLLPGDLWTVHCGLHGTDCGHCNRAELVCNVSTFVLIYMVLLVLVIVVTSCPTQWQNLQDFYEGFAIRTREHAKNLAGSYSRKKLWDNYVIISTIMVFFLPTWGCLTYCCTYASLSAMISLKPIYTNW